MPKMGGLEATTNLRKIGFTGLIIGVTGNSAREDIQAFLECGAEDVLIKPITFSQVEECVTLAVRTKLKQGADKVKLQPIIEDISRSH
jgi:DNA-binding response OmpR family regulator